MKSYFKIIILLLAATAITLLVAPLIASILPFHLYRVMSRVVMLVTFLLFYQYRNKLGIASIKSLGFSSKRNWWFLLFLGLVLAMFSVAVIMFIMVATSVRFLVPDLKTAPVIWDFISYLLSGFIVALIEETFFRGFVLQSLRRDTSLALTLIVTNFFYAIIHFFRPEVFSEIKVLNIESSLLGLRFFIMPLVTNWQQIWPDFLGLFLIGLVLSFAYLRTGSLALSIGLHAGWIVGMKMLSLTTDVTRLGSLWVNGKLVSHPLTWGVLLLFILILNLNVFKKQDLK